MAEDRPGKENRSWRARALAALLVALAALAAVLAADRVLRIGLFPTPLAAELRAAALAVSNEKTDGDRVVDARTSTGSVLALQLPEPFKRADSIALFLELEQMRRECEDATCEVFALRQLEATDQETNGALARIASLRRTASSRLDEFLKLEPERAELGLAALGWPWAEEGHIEPPYPAFPDSLGDLSVERRRELLRDASRDEPWQQTASRLAESYGLADVQIRALKAHVLRRSVRDAFRCSAAQREAVRSLERLASFAPVQSREVLAMAGAQRLIEAGRFGLPPLIDMLEKRPDLAGPLLRECALRAGIRRQARQAAEQLDGDQSAEAEASLIALGPFAIEAINAVTAERGGRAGPSAERVHRALEARWPPGQDAFEALGNDPALWRTWYDGARDAL